MIPAFRVEELRKDASVGCQTPDRMFVCRGSRKAVIELAVGKPPHYALIQPFGSTSEVLRDDFIIGKFFQL
jgi:hypothetical protein